MKHLLLLLILLISFSCSKREEAKLLCHVGGTMTPLMKTLVEKYEKVSGVKIAISSGGSGELLANIEMHKEGDLYVCHDPFIDILMKKGLGVNGWTIGTLYPVLVVQKGNPKNIKGLHDLLRKDVELFLTDYRHSSLGRMLSTIFTKAGIDFVEFNKNKVVNMHRSGSYAANSVKMGNADVALVWQAVASLRKESLDVIEITEFIPTPYVDMVTSATGKSYYLTPMRVNVSTLKCSKNKEAAEAFAEYLVSDDVIGVLEKFGFGVSKEMRKKEYKDGVKL